MYKLTGVVLFKIASDMVWWENIIFQASMVMFIFSLGPIKTSLKTLIV